MSEVKADTTEEILLHFLEDFVDGPNVDFNVLQEDYKRFSLCKLQLIQCYRQSGLIKCDRAIPHLVLVDRGRKDFLETRQEKNNKNEPDWWNYITWCREEHKGKCEFSKAISVEPKEILFWENTLKRRYRRCINNIALPTELPNEACIPEVSDVLGLSIALIDQTFGGDKGKYNFLTWPRYYWYAYLVSKALLTKDMDITSNSIQYLSKACKRDYKRLLNSLIGYSEKWRPTSAWHNSIRDLVNDETGAWSLRQLVEGFSEDLNSATQVKDDENGDIWFNLFGVLIFLLERVSNFLEELRKMLDKIDDDENCTNLNIEWSAPAFGPLVMRVFHTSYPCLE